MTGPLPGEAIGQVYVLLRPNAQGFSVRARKEISEAEKQLPALDINVDLDTALLASRARAAVREAQAAAGHITVPVNFDEHGSIRSAMEQLRRDIIRASTVKFSVKADPKEMNAVLDVLERRLAQLGPDPAEVERQAKEAAKAAAKVAEEAAKEAAKAAEERARQERQLQADLAEERKRQAKEEAAEQKRLAKQLSDAKKGFAKAEADAQRNLDRALAEARLKAEQQQQDLLRRLRETNEAEAKESARRQAEALTARMQEAADRIRNESAEMTVGARVDQISVEKARVEIEKLLLRQEQLRLEIETEVDPLKKAKAEAEIEAMRLRIRDIRVNINVDVDRGAIGRVRSLGSAIDRLLSGAVMRVQSLVTQLPALTRGILSVGRGLLIFSAVSVGGAAVGVLFSGLRDLAGLLPVIPGLAAAAALGIGTMVVAFQGMSTYAPEAKAAVDDLVSSLKATIGQNFWTEASSPFTGMVEALKGTLNNSFGEVSTALGNWFGRLFRELGSEQSQGVFAEFSHVVSEAIKNAVNPQDVVGIFDNLLVVSQPSIERMSNAVGGIFNDLDAWLANPVNQQKVKDWADRGIDALGDLKEIGGDLGEIFVDIADAADDAGLNLDNLNHKLDEVVDWANDPANKAALSGTFDLLKESANGVVTALGSVITGLGQLNQAGNDLNDATGGWLGTVGGWIVEIGEWATALIFPPLMMTKMQEAFHSSIDTINADLERWKEEVRAATSGSIANLESFMLQQRALYEAGLIDFETYRTRLEAIGRGSEANLTATELQALFDRQANAATTYDTMQDIYGQHFEDMVGIDRQGWIDLHSTTDQGSKNVSDRVKEMARNIPITVQDMTGDMKSAGRNTMLGMADGIDSGIGAVARAVQRMINEVKHKVKGGFLIESPSKVFKGYGDFMMQGLALGIKDSTPLVASALSDVSAVLNGRMAASVQASLVGASAGTTYNQTFNFAGGAGETTDDLFRSAGRAAKRHF